MRVHARCKLNTITPFKLNLISAFQLKYPWTVIPVKRREDYLKALNDASARGNIGPFAKFVAGLVRAQTASIPGRSRRKNH